ncbi:uncharacterized protein LOC131594917 isoform X2 [Vicia villosa]|uniref:uncharacterized protein LOC131594917 isoform X2 n=1 Tax=Vicia villosa TaxID=3911 RepID=UPI00273BDAEA|nr:uncharacterized protein LOC131594917 isoform X2 [Vicia villosa]
MADSNKKEIQIRTLTGDSITLHITPTATVQHLKLLLNHSFSPATNSPNFHLFFKGNKLQLLDEIGSYLIQDGEFLVLIPFVKKEPTSTEKPNPANVVFNASTSNLADTTWSNIMEDLSELRQTTQEIDHNNVSNFETNKNNTVEGEKGIELPYHLILNTLDSTSHTALGERSCEVFSKVLESVNCLSDLPLGQCKLFKRACVKGYCGNDGGGVTCLCPQWLKIVVKSFAFMNIFSAFLHLQGRKVTTGLMKEALDQLAKFGLKLGLDDMKSLSLLCPHLVCFVDDIEKARFGYVIVVVNHSSNNEDQIEDNLKRARRSLYVSKIVSTLKRRECSFRKCLGWAFEQLQFEIGDEMNVKISFEELFAAVKDRDFTRKENKTKRVKRCSTSSRLDMDRIGCHDTRSLMAVDMVEHLKKGIGSEGQIVHIEDICARKAIYSEIPAELSEKMRSALDYIGVSKLYSHQAESIQASLVGKNVVVATMTSSGKSVCYNLPVLEELLKNSSSCALYVFPTKALAQDQLRSLLHMTKEFDADLNIGIYDGDTSHSERTRLRDNSRLLITNPDMLHISILPHHRLFGRILSNLRFLVIDETHTYKGAFGCHTALILRRLKRLCSHVYGAVPSFIFSTATSANPHEHSMELANLSKVELFQKDGSPSARKLFILWNPALRPKAIFNKTRFSMDNDELADESTNFVRSRREILHETAPHLLDSVCAYRGGYIAEERRKIESALFGGKICGVAATNALELGIDVGEIDVTLHLGFPGSIASLWQQAGRGGRRDRPSLAIYVAFGGPLDQYFMKNPRKLFERPIECCHIDTQNKQVLEQHLVCAAHEHPLSVQYDEQYFGACLESVLSSLKDRGYLCPDLSDSSRVWNYIGPEKLPSQAVNIRAIETVRYSVIDQKKNEVLEEIEESKAFFQVYEGAVYLRQGKTYLVEKLDLSSKAAFCKEADLKYYTKTRDYTDIHVIGGNIAYPVIDSIMFPKTNVRANVCQVTTTWFGFYRIRKGSNQIIDSVDLALPQYSYESQAVWVPVPQSIKEAVVKQNYDFRGGLHAASHAVLHVVPLHIMCNLSDLAPECPNPHDSRYYPERILIYDQHPGGSGISVQAQPHFTKFLAAALEVLTCCRCTADVGCPNCIQSFACHEYNEVLHKDAAIMIIKGILDAEN